MSQTMVTLPIVGAVDAAREFLGPNPVWRPENDYQGIFLGEYYEPGLIDMKHFNPDELKHCASRSASIVDKFFADNNFPEIKMDQPPDDGFVTGSILRVLTEWVQKGIEEPLIAKNKKEYPAFRLESHQVSYFSSPHHNELIAQLATKNGDRVFLTKFGEANLDIWELVRLRQKIRSTLKAEHNAASWIHIPMIDLDQTVDINWILRLNTRNQEGIKYLITQAVQKTRFKMNHKGALTESGVGMVFVTECMRIEPPPLIIDEPPLLWIERPNVSQPIITAHLTQEDWRQPADFC